MTQKSYAEAMRALVLYTASWQDRVRRRARRRDATSSPRAVNDLLLPIVKGYGSERSWVLLGTESLQTFGGSGFLQDYPIEQYVRDAKIDTLYEGTTAIQGQDLFFRKIVKDQGRRSATSPTRSRPSSRPRPATAGSRRSVSCSPRRSRTPRRSSARMIKDLMTADASAEGGDVPQHLQGRPQHEPAADGARRRGLRLAAAARRRGRARQARRRRVGARTRRSTRARSRRRSSSPGRTCRGSRPSGPSPRPPT